MSDEQKNKNPYKDQSLSEILREITPFLSIGTQLAFTVLAGVFMGKWLDDKYDTSPIWIITFSMSGLFLGLYSFIRKTTKSKKNNVSKQ